MGDDVLETIEESELVPDQVVPDEADPQMDDLHGIALDHEADAQAAKATQLAAGWYTTLPPCTFYRRDWEDDDGSKRVVFQGQVAVVNDKDGVTEGRVQVRFSHMRRNKRAEDGSDTGKPDWSTQTYLKIKRMYQKANGSEPSNLGELIDFLQTYPWRVRLIQGDTDNVALGFDAVKA